MSWFEIVLYVILAVVGTCVALARAIEEACDEILSVRDAIIAFAIILGGNAAIYLLMAVFGLEFSWFLGLAELLLVSFAAVWVTSQEWYEMLGVSFYLPIAVAAQVLRFFAIQIPWGMLVFAVGMLAASLLGISDWSLTPIVIRAIAVIGALVLFLDEDFAFEGGGGGGYSPAEYTSSSPTSYTGTQPTTSTPSYSPPTSTYTAPPSPTIGNWDANTYGAAQTGRQNGQNF